MEEKRDRWDSNDDDPKEEEERACKKEKVTECPSHDVLILLADTIEGIKQLNAKAKKYHGEAHFFCTVDNDKAVQQYQNAVRKFRQMRDLIEEYLD